MEANGTDAAEDASPYHRAIGDLGRVLLEAVTAPPHSKGAPVVLDREVRPPPRAAWGVPRQRVRRPRRHRHPLQGHRGARGRLRRPPLSPAAGDRRSRHRPLRCGEGSGTGRLRPLRPPSAGRRGRRVPEGGGGRTGREGDRRRRRWRGLPPTTSPGFTPTWGRSTKVLGS